jgi:hypothetical protein
MALKLEWGLNEGTGTTSADSSGSGHNATVSGWATGHTSFGSANAKFVGTLIASPAGFTILGWAKPLTNNPGDTVLALGNDEAASSWWFEIDWADSTHLQIDIQAPGHSQQTTPASVTTAVGTWVHVAMSWASATNTVTLLLGGVSRATLTAAGSFTTAGFFTAGSWDFYSNVNATVIDDARVDDGALSPAAVTTYMNTPVVSMPHGGAAGTVAYVGAASGHSVRHGASAGTVGYVGAASGHTTSHGAATGELAFTGEASGHVDPHGSASGAVTYTGASSGHAPDVTQPHGTATGSVTYAGSASGSMQPSGGASGAVGYTGEASGHLDPHGAGDSATAYVGATSGHAPTVGVPHGSASGVIEYASAATGHMEPQGTVAGAVVYHGTAHGTSSTDRDLTLTVTPLAPRWATTPLGTRWTVTSTPERWETTCLQP